MDKHIKHPLQELFLDLFNNGMLAVQRSAEELLKEVNQRAQEAKVISNPFLVTLADELNELAPAEVLAGIRFLDPHDIESQTLGVHPSQERILKLSLEERVAKVIHVAGEWAEEHPEDPL